MGDVQFLVQGVPLVAFDLDGTLVDSRRDLADSANEMIVELGGTPLSEEVIVGMVGEGAGTLVRRVVRAAGLIEPREALTRFLAIYDTRLLNHTRPYDGVVDAVTELRKRGPVAVLTNKPLPATERILAGLELRGLFAAVIGGDGPFPRKPDPASLRHLMAQFAAEPRRTVLVGDSHIDLQTARAAGAASCLAAYGFGLTGVAREPLQPNELIVAHASDIPASIDRLLEGPHPD